MDDAAPVLPERSLDLLRVVAVTCVVADHALGLWGGTVLRVPLGTVGHLGVAIFFVHTAAVLMASLERMHEQGARDTRLALRFYLRRVLRIYPLALVAIGLVVLAAIPPTAGRLAAPPVFVPPSASSLAANLALVQNLVPGTLLLISVLWTLPIELQLYVLLPFAWMAARRSAALAWLVAGAAIVLGAIARSGMDGVLAPINAVRFAPCFAGGVLA
ncbi:MAG: acyltransferase, partial [Gemmatimonadetes bacterium]|nr:acyltransferase [Gemmatimonadota bacterium]